MGARAGTVVRRLLGGSEPLKKLAVLFLILTVNSAYLAARADAHPFYFANVVLHLVLGLALLVAGTRMLWRRRRELPAPLRAGGVLLYLAGLAGVALMITGATRSWRWLLYTHIALAVAGALAVAAHLLRGAALPAGQRGPAVAAAAVVVLAVVAGGGLALQERSASARRERIVNPEAPASMDGEGSGPQSPFFPSSARTNVGGIIPANFFMTSATCGRCHKDIYDQWNSSAHHFSSFNNQWYRKSVEYMQDVVGTQPSKWCAGCHDHAVFFNGRFERPIKEQIDTPEAQAGLSCTSCHSIVHVGSTMGQGDFTIEYPPLHDLAVSENKLLSWTHDFLINLDPAPHKKVFLKSFHRQQTPEFCSSCHKVHLDVPVNKYRWFRGFNDYDNWQASGVSGEGARSFYYPAKPQKCADCHMPLVAADDPAAKNGKVRSHRFAAANTALPYVNGDAVQLKAVQDFLRDGQVSVDVFGLVRAPEREPAPAAPRAKAAEPTLASTFAQGEEAGNLAAAQTVLEAPVEVLAPLDKVSPVVRRGESVRVEVVVRTRKVGHFFPGGTVDAFDVWVELEAVDDKGRTVFHSGSVEDGGKGPVEPGAHMYRSLLLDERGNPINKRNAWMARSVAYVRLIPPGAADTVHYRLRVPADAGDAITLRAKVNYRKFAWYNTQWAFAGVPPPDSPPDALSSSHDSRQWRFTGETSRVSGPVKAIPDIPITVMATSEATLRVLPRDAALPEQKALLDKSVRERWNDYGIGLLLQGHIKAAEDAFLKVTQMEPGYADGWVNVARARIQEGNMAAAEEVLRQALEIDPKLAKTHFFLASALKPMGRYDEAIGHLRQAAALYPRDRVVLNQLGRILFLKRQYHDAIAEFQKVLAIDPEDLQAQYNLMLCWQGLKDPEKAAAYRARYERFKADEASQFITGPYRQLHPHDNNERQQIHEHRSATPEPPGAPEKKSPSAPRTARGGAEARSGSD
jgi:tetratricopeptide (TPR) repeat protein